MGIFERAKVLWAGIEPSEALDRLAAQVRESLSAAGITYDPQDFKAHITLIRKPVLPDEDTLIHIKAPPASMVVREACLYKSEHLENGMQYTVIGRSETLVISDDR